MFENLFKILHIQGTNSAAALACCPEASMRKLLEMLGESSEIRTQCNGRFGTYIVMHNARIRFNNLLGQSAREDFSDADVFWEGPHVPPVVVTHRHHTGFLLYRPLGLPPLYAVPLSKRILIVSSLSREQTIDQRSSNLLEMIVFGLIIDLRFPSYQRLRTLSHSDNTIECSREP
ncbi:hypothetical protein BJ170DRAFT_599101 [Xylariales sp. AK1849]|nr:hypothetical protein BJ170DRAFT_599101 [Xylariales sp. AK1849]